VFIQKTFTIFLYPLVIHIYTYQEELPLGATDELSLHGPSTHRDIRNWSNMFGNKDLSTGN